MLFEKVNHLHPASDCAAPRLVQNLVGNNLANILFCRSPEAFSLGGKFGDVGRYRCGTHAARIAWISETVAEINR